MSSPLLAPTRFRLVLATSVLLLLASTRTSSPLLASTRFKPVCYSRLLAYSRLASTRILASTGTGGDASCPTCVFLLLASTRRSSPVLAITRLYSHTCVYWHWWGCMLPLMCFSLLLAYTRMSSPLFASTRFSPLLASTRMSARMSSRPLDSGRI